MNWEELVDISLDDAGLSHSKVTDHQDFEQILLFFSGRALQVQHVNKLFLKLETFWRFHCFSVQTSALYKTGEWVNILTMLFPKYRLHFLYAENILLDIMWWTNENPSGKFLTFVFIGQNYLGSEVYLLILYASLLVCLNVAVHEISYSLAQWLLDRDACWGQFIAKNFKTVLLFVLKMKKGNYVQFKHKFLSKNILFFWLLTALVFYINNLSSHKKVKPQLNSPKIIFNNNNNNISQQTIKMLGFVKLTTDLPSVTHFAWKSRILLVLHAQIFNTSVATQIHAFLILIRGGGGGENFRELTWYLSKIYQMWPLLLKFIGEQDSAKILLLGYHMLPWQPHFRCHVYSNFDFLNIFLH